MAKHSAKKKVNFFFFFFVISQWHRIKNKNPSEVASFTCAKHEKDERKRNKSSFFCFPFMEELKECKEEVLLLLLLLLLGYSTEQPLGSCLLQGTRQIIFGERKRKKQRSYS
ncbi:hypothetical protein AAHE18_03G354800 [Arachis hypogaea]